MPSAPDRSRRAGPRTRGAANSRARGTHARRNAARGGNDIAKASRPSPQLPPRSRKPTSQSPKPTSQSSKPTSQSPKPPSRSRTDPRKAPSIRRATQRDLGAILDLERACFQPYRQASVASLRRSLASRRQSVWVVDAQDGVGLDGLLVLWHHPRLLRVYDVATHPRRQGQGLGRALMRHAEAVARRGGQAVVSLEADPKEPGLVAWYERQGFVAGETLQEYYKNGNAAVRLRKDVT